MNIMHLQESMLRNSIAFIMLLATCVGARAQDIKEVPFKSDKFGVSFDYKSSFKVKDMSEGNQFKVVATLEGVEFIFTAIPETPGHTVAEFSNYIHDYMQKADAAKTNFRITDNTASEVSGNKVYYTCEFYDKETVKNANHIMILDLPFKYSMGIMLKVVSPYDPELEKLVLREMLAMLASFKKV